MVGEKDRAWGGMGRKSCGTWGKGAGSKREGSELGTGKKGEARGRPGRDETPASLR